MHPGPAGDRGPSSLDWAIELERAEWGVTVLQATGELDGGPTSGRRARSRRGRPRKSSLYRHEVRRAAVEAVVEAVGRIAAGEPAPAPPDGARPAASAR